MACKFLYENVWYTEGELRAIFDKFTGEDLIAEEGKIVAKITVTKEEEAEDVDDQVDVTPQIEQLKDFSLFDNAEKICSQGVCNYTALMSTEALQKAGLNPFPNITGNQLGVSVKSPLGDFFIRHFVSAVAINNGVYIYDMPQNEFISSEFFGRGGPVTLKTTYKPRLIPLNLDSIKANYNLNSEQAARFIRSILNTGESNINPSFENYIKNNVENPSDYIDNLKKQISQEGVNLDRKEEYKLKNETEERLKEQFAEKKLAEPLTDEEFNKVANFLRTKLKIKTKAYLPTKTEEFTLFNLIKSVTGVSFSYTKDNIRAALRQFRDYTNSEQFLTDVWNNYSKAKENYDELYKSVDMAFSAKALMGGYLKLAQTYGIEGALKKYDNKQQYRIRELLPSDLKKRYVSEKQAIFMLTKRFNNMDNILDALNINFGAPYVDTMKKMNMFRSQLEKASTVLNFLKATSFDATEIYQAIESEALRRYEYFSSKGQLSFQMEEMPSSVASPDTISRVKELLVKMGVSIENLVDYAKRTGLDSRNVNAVADLVRKVVAVAEGKENVALTEEMVHIATAIIEQTNPKLITEMISKIDRFKIYQDTLKAYKDRKEYQLPNGKPDIRKIKKEAVDKLITEVIINGNQSIEQYPELREENNQSLIRRFWNAITDWFRGMYRKSDINLFEEVAQQIMEGRVEGDIVGDGIFLQQVSSEQKAVLDEIEKTKKLLHKRVGESSKTDPMFMDTEEADNYYEMEKPDGTFERIVKRVTDRVKQWYRERFPGKVFTPEEKKFNEVKREFGIAGHSDFQEIHGRYFNSDGTRKDKPSPRPLKFNLPTQEMYDKLEKYYVDLVNSLGKDTLILSEVMIYDPKQKEAGTLDFLAIQKDGTAHIFDWKFMFLKKNQSDIPFFKQGAYNVQLGRYKEMLRENYGVKKFGKIRAIPILMEFKPKNPNDLDQGWNLKGIVVGSADPDKIEDVRLLPLSEETESTGYEALDKVLSKLNKLMAMIGQQKVTDEEERELKYERQRVLRNAIRVAQTQLDIVPLIEVIEVMRKEGVRIMNDYTTTYEKRPPSSTDSNNKELSDFSDDMNDYLATARVFTDIGRQIGDLIYEESMDKKAKTKEEKEEVQRRKDLLIKLNSESNAIFKSMEQIQKASQTFADKHIGERNLVFGLLKPERVLKGLGSMFRGVSELPLRSLEILSKLTGVAQTKAAAAALEKVKELMAIRERLAKRGGDLRSMVQRLYQKDTKGGLVNKLIYKYKDEFRKTVDAKAEAGGDMVWLRSNIDVEAYKKEADEVKKKLLKRIDETNYPGTQEQVDERRDYEKELVERQWNIDYPGFTGWNNYVIKRHPKEKWLSDEYLEISKDEDLLALYNFISKFNEEAKNTGYINADVMRTFLPFIRKGMAEELAWDNTLSVMQNWKNTVQLRADDVGYGAYNELTGELENTIPKYYTYDFTYKGDGVNDYSDVSEDLFKNLILYIQQVEKYKYLSEVEGQLKLVKTIEEFKGHLNTNKTGEVVMKDGKPHEVAGNEENTKMFDDFLRVLLYDQKYVLSDVDLPLNMGKVLNFVKRSVNKVAGTEVFKPDEDVTPSSLIKTIDAANRAFQLKTLGFEFISGAVNAFGGNIQLATQAGNYFKAREFLANEAKIINQSFASEEEKEMFMQLIEAFMPLKDDPSYELMKKAGMSPLTRGSMSDTLMWFMRFPEQVIEKSIFVTLLQNTMVVDGKIVNIREYVKGKYKDRYDSAAKYKQVKTQIESEIEDFKSKKSVWVTKELKDGKLVIPGLDLSDKVELQRLTNLTKNISSNVTGNMTKQSINRMSMNIWTKSMMLFKNWIPKLADTRFGEFRRITDDFSIRVDEEGNITGQKYDIGRIRLLGDVLLRDNIFKGIANINNILSLNDEGLALMDAMFEEYREKYERETGEKLNMTREEFIDLIRTNLRNQVKELAVLASLLGAMMALGFMVPDDDEDKATKNLHRYAQRVVDKFVSELSFFYNPAEIEQTLSGGIFPAVGIANDFSKFTNHLFMQTTGWDLDPTTSTEDVRKKALPIKYAMKMAPITKSLVTYLAILDEDFAKEYKVTIQKENRR